MTFSTVIPHLFFTVGLICFLLAANASNYIRLQTLLLIGQLVMAVVQYLIGTNFGMVSCLFNSFLTSVWIGLAVYHVEVPRKIKLVTPLLSILFSLFSFNFGRDWLVLAGNGLITGSGIPKHVVTSLVMLVLASFVWSTFYLIDGHYFEATANMLVASISIRKIYQLQTERCYLPSES